MLARGHWWDPLSGWSGKASLGGDKLRDTSPSPSHKPDPLASCQGTRGPTLSHHQWWPVLLMDSTHLEAQVTKGAQRADPSVGAHLWGGAGGGGRGTRSRGKALGLCQRARRAQGAAGGQTVLPGLPRAIS